MVQFKTVASVLTNVQIYVLACLFVLLFPSYGYAQFSDEDADYTITEQSVSDASFLKTISFNEPIDRPLTYTLDIESSEVKDEYPYSGMAIYLGMAPAVKVLRSGRVKIIKFKGDDEIESDGEWTGYKGRFQAVLVRTETGVVNITKDVMSITWPAGITPDLTILTGKPDSSMPPNIEGALDIRKLQYSHLPRWMRFLCNLVEWLFKSIQSVTGMGWGLTLLIFAIVIKLVLFPVAVYTARFQSQANSHKTALEPIFNDIKKNFKGEVAHKKVMAAYKARGITPYYSLKPLLATMISLPVLIAIFNMLAEVEPLKDAGLFWINSFAYPDAISRLPAQIILFGQSLNLLPFVMAGVTFFSAYTLKSKTASMREISRQKRNLFLMGTAFFLIFYPFPSAMVLYWTLSTILQSLANKFIKNS